LPESVPAKVGVLKVTGKAVQFSPPRERRDGRGKPAAAMAMIRTKEGDPTTVQVGSVSFFVIARSGSSGSA